MGGGEVGRKGEGGHGPSRCCRGCVAPRLNGGREGSARGSTPAVGERREGMREAPGRGREVSTGRQGRKDRREVRGSGERELASKRTDEGDKYSGERTHQPM